jgi:hypothetical protein
MAGYDEVPGRRFRRCPRALLAGFPVPVLVPEASVSSAILYLAIIAIWAGFLVPAWVRRPHTRSEEPSPETELSYAVGSADAEESAEPHNATESGVGATVAAEVQFEIGEHVHDGGEYYEVEYREEEYLAAAYPDEYTPVAGQGGEPLEDGAGPGEGEWDNAYQQEAHRPSQTREQMLRARRRMLGVLLGMTLVTMAFTALGLVAWWICVPPAGLLVGYVLLLRQIAQADAELARKRSAWEHAQALAYERHLQPVAERQAYEASLPQPEPEAEIIDISRRVADTDQLYDQYADAAARAVGD